jgi:hypothetical protein
MLDTQARALVHASAAGLMTYNPWNTPQLKDVFRRELAIRLLEKQIAPAPDWASTSRQEFTLLKELSSNGVPVLAGTDLGSLLIYPGFSLHDELQGLVDQVGLMPVEALRAATVAPAQFSRQPTGAGSPTASGPISCSWRAIRSRHQNDPPHP